MQRQKCEKFSRAMGYIRPVDNFNIGKRAEFEERNTFCESVIFGHIRNLFKTKEDEMPCGKKKSKKITARGQFFGPDLAII